MIEKRAKQEPEAEPVPEFIKQLAAQDEAKAAARETRDVSAELTVEDAAAKIVDSVMEKVHEKLEEESENGVRDEDLPTEKNRESGEGSAESEPPSSIQSLNNQLAEASLEIERLRNQLDACQLINIDRHRVTTNRGRISVREFNGQITEVLHG